MMNTAAAEFFKGKHVLVFGLGILGGGVGVVQTLLKYGAIVRVTDTKSAQDLASALEKIDIDQLDKLVLEKHEEEDIIWSEVVIKNPAVPSSHPLIQKALEAGKDVTTEAALYLKLSQAYTIGITGTRGKTTTTLMTYQILKDHLDHRVIVGGNIQDKGCLPLLLEEDAETVAVVELSSWALEGCHWEKVSPRIAVLTNLYPDHLNRYSSMEAYAYDKAAIFLYQSEEDHCFLNTQHDWFEYYVEKVPSNLHLYDHLTLPESIQLKVAGEHNRINAGAAFSVAKLMGIERDQITESLEAFAGAPSRQEIVGQKDELTFINDSTSTTPKALEVALKAFPKGTFIIGGTTKNLPLSEVVNTLKDHQGKLVFLKGSGTSELLDELARETKKSYSTHGSLAQAFAQAVKDTPSGEIVFSPGFTSFELFKNEFDRAEQFKTLVEKHCRHE